MEEILERPTGDLVLLLLDGTGASVGTAVAVAGAIEAGELAALVSGGSVCRRADLSLAATRRLTAALELARRASLAPRPTVLRGPCDVGAIALRELGGLWRERVLVIMCDAGNRLIGMEIVAQGGQGRCLFPVREILAAALRVDSGAFALAHNHPSGDPSPSEADIDATRRVAEAARTVGLRFLGHVVAAGTCYRPVTVSPTTEYPVESGRHERIGGSELAVSERGDRHDSIT